MHEAIGLLHPVLAAILASNCSRTCSLLIKHLEDKLIHLLGRCLNALLKPWGRRFIKLPTKDQAAVRDILLPYKKEVLILSQQKVSVAKKRKILDQALRKHPEFHEVLAGIAKTLNELLESQLKENEL